MRSKYFVLAALMMTVLMLSSCDDHYALDADVHNGYIMLSDGRIIRDTDYDPSCHTAVAVVFAEKTDEHPVLAVMLDECSSVAFSDTLSFVQGTSCKIDAFDGYVNTVALQGTVIKRPGVVNENNASDPANYYKSPLGLLAFRSHYHGQSDYVPSIAELRLLFRERDKVNAIIRLCGGTPISDSAVGGGCWYWSSTEVSENAGNQAWLISMTDGSIQKAPKTNSYNARLIVEYNGFYDSTTKK